MMSALPRPLLRSVGWAALVLACAGPVHALSLVPMEMEFGATGRNTARVFRVDNPGTEAAAVEISARTRRVNEEGDEQLDDADDDFAIFPRQIVLRPGQSQAVRVQWLGKGIPPRELAYRLIAEQLPLDPPLGKPLPAVASPTAPQARELANAAPPLAANGVQIRVLMRYEAAVYVVPPGARGRVEARDVERLYADTGAAGATHAAGTRGPRLRITLENTGTAHVLLRNAQLTLTGADGAAHVLAGAQLADLADANLLAGTRRRFLLPAPAQLPPGPLTARIEGSWPRP